MIFETYHIYPSFYGQIVAHLKNTGHIVIPMDLNCIFIDVVRFEKRYFLNIFTIF